MSDLTTEQRRDRSIVEELADPAAVLFERHLSVSKRWYPFEDIPFERAREFRSGEEFDDTGYPLSDGVKSALVVNLLTEDNLPYYTSTLLAPVREDHPLREWTRRWTAEEWRHSAAIRDWILSTRAVDPYQLEDDRMVQMSNGLVPESPNVTELISYVSFQELATQVAHRNTGQALDKEGRGKKVMSKVAGDEGLHYAFYRDLVKEAIAIDPSTMVVAIQRQLRGFKMPGFGIPGFEHHQQVIADAGIFDARQFVDSVVKPTLEAWGLFELDGLDDGAERARDRIRRNVAALERLARVSSAPRTEPSNS